MRVTTLPVPCQKLGPRVYLSRTDDALSTPFVWHNFLSPLKIVPLSDGTVLLMVIEDIV
jgi:hypothetical protein